MSRLAHHLNAALEIWSDLCYVSCAVDEMIHARTVQVGDCEWELHVCRMKMK